ncbi:hypothetical protein [Paenibacillus borealis]|uniref:Uncharacterized protein n=1 Tax=Paenibacillus borealis TaxID=160799 RepID=A0A089MJ55_PAEBO|nr:hypothetical protein [Paenibacillus borealis]AIQ56609.1 hypothetical protein PBOR_06400 [Paenibacillus borealis]
MKRKGQWILAGAAALILLYGGYEWFRPQHVEREYSSVIYSNNEVVKHSTIGLKGDVWRGVPGSSEFTGELTLDGALHYDVKLKDSGGYYMGILTVLDAYRSRHSIGSIIASQKLDKFWIMLTDLDERYGLAGGEGYISGPANTLEEALQTGKDILGSDIH